MTITGTSGSTTHTTTIALTVNATAQPNFTIGASPSSVTVTQGGNGTSTITITSQNSFSSATTLSCYRIAQRSYGGVLDQPGYASGQRQRHFYADADRLGYGNNRRSHRHRHRNVGHADPQHNHRPYGEFVRRIADRGLRFHAESSEVRERGVGMRLGSIAAAWPRHSSGGSEPNQPNTINSSCADGTSGTFHSDESNDRLAIATTDGSTLAAGKTVKVSATVWAYSWFHLRPSRPLLRRERKQSDLGADRNARSHSRRSANAFGQLHAAERELAGGAGAVPLPGKRVLLHYRFLQRPRRSDLRRGRGNSGLHRLSRSECGQRDAGLNRDRARSQSPARTDSTRPPR